jgi:hypothetical protein
MIASLREILDYLRRETDPAGGTPLPPLQDVTESAA